MTGERFNNPAARLHALLTQIVRMPEGNSAPICFSAALGVNSNETPKLLRRLAELVNLAVLAEEQVRAIPGANVDLHLSWKAKVYQAFGGITLLGQIGLFVQPLKSDNSMALERLQFCADFLARERPEKQIEDSDLDGIRRDADELRKEVLQSSIDAELNLFVVYQLGFILDAIDQFRVFGLRPLERATNETLGALLLNSEVRERMPSAPFGKKFWGLLRRAHLIVAVAREADQIMETVRKLLPWQS